MLKSKKPTKSALLLRKKLPPRAIFGPTVMLLYDSRLSRYSAFSRWAQNFTHRLPLTAGEELKSLSAFTSVLNKITKLDLPRTTELTFIVVGGGSVGDFGGFLASVYLRGRPLVQVPSTWLSAVDSAHGGKNGLNFGGAKNQIGTFYLPQKTIICTELLSLQPAERLSEAYGEMLKIAVLGDRKLFAELASAWQTSAAAKVALKQLPRMIALKNKIVKIDPYEKNGHRRLLNLGHTLGHVIESQTGLAHGHAVALGLLFSARWSHRRGWLSEEDVIAIAVAVENLGLNLTDTLSSIPPVRIARLLARDKKLTSDQTIDFIFIKKIGEGVRHQVKVSDILSEVQRQLTED